MAPTALVDLGMALAWEGFDVDTIPYGQAVTANELQGSDLVVVLPVLDYPSPDGDPGLYDVGWSAEEIAALEAYVAEGGFLVLTNSANRLKYGNTVLDPNEDWMDANDLAGSFGISFQNEVLGGEKAWSEGEHPLLEGVASLSLAENNAVAFRLTGGTVLARSLGEPAVALVDHAHGQVLVLADVGILGAEWGTPANLQFWRNLARYARQ
jgi:hypothetical protein